MTRFSAARLEEIDEVTDGRCPLRPVRLHLGITSFGVNAFTGREQGDRIINEHDEGEEADAQEELYFVHAGRARFELDGEQLDAPTGTFVFVPAGVMRTAFAEEPGTTIIAVGGAPGRVYVPTGFELWMPLFPLFEAGRYAEVADRGREAVAAHPECAALAYNVACAERALRGGRTTRSTTSGWPSSANPTSVRSSPETPTSIRFATTPPFKP